MDESPSASSWVPSAWPTPEIIGAGSSQGAHDKLRMFLPIKRGERPDEDPPIEIHLPFQPWLVEIHF